MPENLDGSQAAEPTADDDDVSLGSFVSFHLR